MTLLENAFHICLDAHKDQKDKGGKPYILHPIHLSTKFEDETLKIIALLHDVIEDSNYTLKELALSGYSKEVINALNALTKRKGESYKESIERVKLNPLATKVKLEDLQHNMNVTRLSKADDISLKSLKKYLSAHKYLSS